MLSNITIGQYYPAKSLLHRMDPRMKVILTAVFIVLIFLANNFASMALVLAFLGITVALSRVPLKMILRGLKAIVIIVVFTSVLNLFYVQGGKPWLISGLSISPQRVCIPRSLWQSASWHSSSAARF